MEIETKLHKELSREFDELGKLTPGTDEHKASAEVVTKLMDKAIEIERLHVEKQKDEDCRKTELDLKLKQMEGDRKDQLIKNVLNGVAIIGGFAVTVWGTCKSIKFEETGTITTIMGRGFINKLLPKK